MKNVVKYSFSILIMISCVILFTITAFKVIVIEELSKDGEMGAFENEKQESGKDEKTDKAEHEEKTNNDAAEAVDPAAAPFTTADASYFADALFIGDSRTIGLREYGQFEGASFFANTGMSVYNVNEKTVDVEGVGSVTLDQLLASRDYGKIYLMLGINELGYNRDNTVNKYKTLVDYIREKSPKAILYIGANLHVAAARSDSDNIFNNVNINDFNERISKFADNKNVFYIDANEIFDDGNGNLTAEYTSDNTHVLGKYYVMWKDWILTKAIVK